MEKQNTLIVGAGNPLMGDDGAGIAVLNALEQFYNFPYDVFDCGTDLLRLGILDKSYQNIIIIDSVRSGTAPGTIRCFAAEMPDQFSKNDSVHQLSVLESLQLLPLMNPVFRDTAFFIIGIEPESVSTVQTLSEPVRHAVKILVQFFLPPNDPAQLFSDYGGTCQGLNIIAPLIKSEVT